MRWLLILLLPVFLSAQMIIQPLQYPTVESEDRSPIAIWSANSGITTVDTGGTYATVSSWLSTNGEYDVVQTTATRRPLYNTDSVALKFDGVDDYLFYDASSPNIFDPRTDDFSVTAWVYASFVSEQHEISQYILSKGYGYSTSLPGFSFYLHTDIIYSRIFTPFRLSSSTTASICNIYTYIYTTESAWRHIAISVDRDGEAIVYVDGVNRGSQDISAYNNDDIWSSYAFKMGARHYNDYLFTSFIAEVRYYKVVLTQSEVEALYNAGRP